MKLAILIGVSEYQTLDDLPACKSDIELVDKLLGATGKYEEILSLSENTEGARVKEQIASAIKNLQSKKGDIDEIFFYYTGHGDLFEGEFYYVLSDFEKSKRKQTCLENSEVDSWLRSLSPKLTIKVVDACHAGITYIKDDSALEKHLRESQGNFSKCYFMFSSKLDQSSYQDRLLSFFTRSFMQAIYSHETDEIRYKDIIDFVADDFRERTDQTPFFIVQADYTEVFCSVSQEVRTAISLVERLTIPILGSSEMTEEDTSPTQTNSESLEQIVKRDADSYRTEEQAMSVLEEIRQIVENYKYPSELRSLYDIKHSFEIRQRVSIPNSRAIGKWLDQNKHEYFAKVESETVRVRDNYGLGAALPYPTREERRITGFQPTVACPFDVIQIDATAKYPNIPWVNCTMVLLLSKTSIRFFFFFANYREKNWRERALPEGVNWQTRELRFREDATTAEVVEGIQDEFANFIIGNIKETFGAGGQ